MTYERVTCYDGEFGYVGEDLADKHEAIKLGNETYLVSGEDAAGVDEVGIKVAYRGIRDDIENGTALVNSTKNPRIFGRLNRILNSEFFYSME